MFDEGGEELVALSLGSCRGVRRLIRGIGSTADSAIDDREGESDGVGSISKSIPSVSGASLDTCPCCGSSSCVDSSAAGFAMSGGRPR